MPFEFRRLEMPDLMLITPRVYEDERGFFLELYKREDFAKAGIHERFVQDNYSKSRKGVLRGLHYQKRPKAQGKLVRCVRGTIFDVAVDIRKRSPHYGRWTGMELSGESNAMLYIPAGFAHGFQAMSDDAEVMYKCTEEYSPEHDAGIAWDDPDINIQWPVRPPILSDKDRIHPRLRDADTTF